MLVEEHNLSVAWAKVFLTVLKENEVSPVVVVVRDISDSGPAEIPEVRDALDELLEGDGKGLSCNTVANTIFPSIWNPRADRQELYDRYNRILPRLRKDQRNKYGLYFQRLTSYGANGDGKGGVNQLEQIIQTWHKRNHRRTALQAGLFDPKTDHTPTGAWISVLAAGLLCPLWRRWTVDNWILCYSIRGRKSLRKLPRAVPPRAVHGSRDGAEIRPNDLYCDAGKTGADQESC